MMRLTNYAAQPFSAELPAYARISPAQGLRKTPSDEIRGSGYVVETLEASLWAVLTTKRFEDAVLKAVNLGDDTDTTGAITGGLAGLCYGIGAVPKRWQKHWRAALTWKRSSRTSRAKLRSG